MLNNEDKPLFIERLERTHRITTGVSILESCSPVSTLGRFPRSIDDIKNYFEQEVKIMHPKPPPIKLIYLGLLKMLGRKLTIISISFVSNFPLRNQNCH